MEKVSDLFYKSSKKNTLESIYTVLRVTGIETYSVDPLKNLKGLLLSTRNRKEIIKILQSSKDFWTVVFNFLRIIEGKRYSPDFMTNVPQKDYYSYGKKLLEQANVQLDSLIPEIKESNADEVKKFAIEFLDHYEKVLTIYNDQPKYYKLPNFDVLEIIKDKSGLIGFKLYFSNGSNAVFTRDAKNTMIINIDLESEGLVFQIGNISDLKKDWRVGSKRLYEIGLTGKYNENGEWKPLVHPGDIPDITRKARELSQDNELAEGIFLYMLATGYPVIEFVVKTRIKFGRRTTKLKNGIVLYNIKKGGKLETIDNRSYCIYDAWLRLEDRTYEGIMDALDTIERNMNLLAFQHDSPVSWDIKYKVKDHTPGAALADYKSLKKVVYLDNQIMSTNKDRHLINAALEWYRKGLESKNVFTAFLCFHISIEGLAMVLVKGRMQVSSNWKFEYDENLEEQLNLLIENYQDEKNPDKFIAQVRLDLDPDSLTVSFKKAVAAVFGKKSKEFELYFKKPKKKTLWDIRGILVHENLSEWDEEQKRLVQERLHIIQIIAKRFITKIILPKSRPRRRKTSKRMISVSMTEPGAAMIVSSEEVLPNKDWRIRPEWIE